MLSFNNNIVKPICTADYVNVVIVMIPKGSAWKYLTVCGA